jgi:hypothetical protein
VTLQIAAGARELLTPGVSMKSSAGGLDARTCYGRLCVGLGAILAAGCAHQNLPVEHVAIYRNGVAYIERAGHVGSREVRFDVKESEVSDFLATLAVTERGGASVHAAASTENRSASEDHKKELQTVVLSLDGAAHDLRVGYLTEAPVWKPSYRLVMREGGASELQMWGLVQNLSGEDWKDIRLSLIAGAPITFSSDIQTPVIPSRPNISDRGESIGAVPRSEMTMAQRETLQGTSLSQNISAVSSSSPASPPPGYGHRSQQGSAAADLPTTPRAASAAFGGTTRYDLPVTVTIADASTTMVMMMSHTVQGDEIFLFAPDPNIPESASHPFRALHFTNDSGGELAPGPISMFAKGAFLGEAMIDSVPAGGSSTLPFALDRSIVVEHEVKGDEPVAGARLVKIEDGQITIEHERARRTSYRLRNGGDAAARVLVKHTLGAHSKLYSPPPGTEQRPGAETALVPATVPAHETSELVVDEGTGAAAASADWFSEGAGYAVRAFLADPLSDHDAVQKLTSAWAQREEAAGKMRERDHLRQHAYDLQTETEELRKNLKAAGGGTGDALRAKLGTRLAQAMAEISELDKKVAMIETAIAQATDRFKRAIQDVRVPR